MADYQTLLERLRDAYNARDADAFAAVWNPDCVEVGWVMEPRAERLQRGWAYTSHAEAERAAKA